MITQHLIPNWKQGLRFFSTQMIAGALAVQTLWQQLPPDFLAQVSPHLQTNLTIGLLIAAGIGRFIKQALPDDNSSNSGTGNDLNISSTPLNTIPAGVSLG